LLAQHDLPLPHRPGHPFAKKKAGIEFIANGRPFTALLLAYGRPGEML